MSIDFESQKVMVEACVKAGKLRILNKLLMKNYDTVNQLRGAIHSLLEKVENGSEDSNKCKD